ncbi:MAG TPA: SRPBCC domain-containing protein [Streptosporangiaceae bacterium]
MELEHSFTVPVPRSRAWDVLLDVERVAPCMPGATLDSVDGDEIHGRIKVKVGPINMTYAGTARFVERDAEAGVVTLEASGKETKGAGTASASVRSVLEDHGNETHVSVKTTLNVTGKPAQFGRGVMNEVGGKLLGIFATNLADLLATLEEGEAAPAEAAAAGAATAPEALLDEPVDELKLPARATASLHNAGIGTLGQLAVKTDDELLAIDGIGPATIVDIKAKLVEHGLTPGQARADMAEAAEAGIAPAGAQAATASTPAAGRPATARAAAHQLEDDAINLIKVAGMPMLKRAIPVLAGLAAALLIGLRRKLRRRNR